MQQAYVAIGRTVTAMQMFEVAFVPIHESFNMSMDEGYHEMSVTTGASAITHVMASYVMHLCETVGMLLAMLPQGRQVAVVPVTDDTLLLAHWLAPPCALAGIRIAFVGGRDDVVDVKSMRGAGCDTSQVRAATGRME
jgi:hypothetical protein